jgi:hypothetical protein
MPTEFFAEGSRLLTPDAFEFVLDGELKRAVRSQNFLTLIVLETRREWEGLSRIGSAWCPRFWSVGSEGRDAGALSPTFSPGW